MYPYYFRGGSELPFRAGGELGFLCNRQYRPGYRVARITLDVSSLGVVHRNSRAKK
ncbi:hypothetical protein ZHAS_00018695 [Anopheles sinensis]|uniref:Uncharacterized protein n=1 Tax=Anopheles sinensis TaxID=74873 RepID=A0A084WKB6_ANOSI|nr:hypothetical protein ZHAS_00018695 [Anopheles sinensis]